MSITTALMLFIYDDETHLHTRSSPRDEHHSVLLVVSRVLDRFLHCFGQLRDAVLPRLFVRRQGTLLC